MVRHALVHREGLDDMATVVEKTAEGSFATGRTRVAASATSVSDLQKLRVSKYVTGDAIFITDDNRHYIWVATSTASIDSTTVILPNSYSKAKAPIGRWIIEKVASVSSSAQLDTDAVAERQTLALVKKTLDDLKKARVSARKNGDGIRVTDLDKVFVWVSTSRLAVDDTNVLLPNSYTKAKAPIGRWVLEGVSLRTGEIPADSAETTTETITTTALNNLILPLRIVDATASPLLVTDTDGIIQVDTTGGNVDVSLPDVATIPVGRCFTIRKVDLSQNVVNINAVGSALVELLTAIELRNIGGATLYSDGTNYHIKP